MVSIPHAHCLHYYLVLHSAVSLGLSYRAHTSSRFSLVLQGGDGTWAGNRAGELGVGQEETDDRGSCALLGRCSLIVRHSLRQFDKQKSSLKEDEHTHFALSADLWNTDRPDDKLSRSSYPSTCAIACMQYLTAHHINNSPHDRPEDPIHRLLHAQKIRL